MLELFTHEGQIHPEIVRQAHRIKLTLTKKQRDGIRATAALLSEPTSRSSVEASRIAKAAGRVDPPSPQALAVACRLGLSELLALSEV